MHLFWANNAEQAKLLIDICFDLVSNRDQWKTVFTVWDGNVKEIGK